MNNKKKTSKKTVNFSDIKRILLSSLSASFFETLIAHPTVVIGNRLVSREKFSLSPKILYRGIIANSLSTMPTIMLSLAMANFFELLFFGKNSKAIEQVISSSLGSACTALISTPAELVLLHQHINISNTSFPKMLSRLYNKYSLKALWTGTTITSIRIALSTIFLVSVLPKLKQVMAISEKDLRNGSLAALAVGLINGVITTPPNTIRIVQQGGNLNQPASLMKTITKIYSREGWAGFFRGGTMRICRSAVGFPIMAYVYNTVSDFSAKGGSN